MKALAAVVITGLLYLPVFSPALAADQEQQIGQQMYQQLLQKGEIIPNAPQYPGASLYSALQPIADRIKAVVDPQYQYPFHFILVHESQPNAFSVPGGNVYVTDSMMRFADNKEELAGVLCHETSHTIHHDVMGLMNKDRNTEFLGTLAQLGSMILTRGNYFAYSGVGVATQLQEQHFSRKVETAADLKGTETCAQAGFNPYGMVWLFQKYQKSGKSDSTAEIFADHPNSGHRIADIESHIAANPAVFGKFSNDIAKANPLKLAPETAVQQPARPYGYGPPQGPYGGSQGPYGAPQGGPYGQPPQSGPYGTYPNGRPAPGPSPAPTQTPGPY